METIYPGIPVIPEEDSVKKRTLLFKQYILPNVNLVYSLCIRYTYSPADVEDNYNEALVNFYKYIETYDPTRSIQTWIHIVTKRFVADLNQKRSHFAKTEDLDVSEMEEEILDNDDVSANCMGMDNYHLLYNDDILNALLQIKPIYREALLLQQAGYKLNEIMEHCHRKGNLKTKNIDTIKSRIFLAKKQMRELVTRDGERRAN